MDPRNRLQEYYKKQAEIGRRAVTSGSSKFVKDYMLPAAKGVAAFTPVGPVIGFLDAYNAYQQGDNVSAMIGAGMEALPYVTKGALKAIKGVKNVLSKKVVEKTDDFVSEIDWAKWNPDTPKHKALMNEYRAIEKSTKEAGTWMKNPDGTPFSSNTSYGLPMDRQQQAMAQFVQSQSSWFKKAFPNVLRDTKGNILYVNHGSYNKFDYIDPKFFGTGTDKGFKGVGTYVTPTKYAKQYGPEMYKFIVNSKNPLYASDFVPDAAPLSSRQGLADPHLKFFHRDVAPKLKGRVNEFRENDLLIGDEFNPKKQEYAFEMVVPFSNRMKSALGNVGFFDMTNPNIYKTLIPTTLATGVASNKSDEKSQLDRYKKGGPIKNFQPNRPEHLNLSKSTNFTPSIFTNGGNLGKTRYRAEDDVYESYYSLPEVTVSAPNKSLAKQVRVGRDKFAQDTMLPAAKIASSFTPIGPVIGLMDAKDMYNKGETGWAMFGAGMEALPYAGKYAVKGIKSTLPTIKKIVKNTHKINPFAFKSNPSFYYRGIGRTGLDDALGANLIRQNPNRNFEYTYLADELSKAKPYSRNEPYGVGDPFGDDDLWKMVQPKDSRSYIAEIPKSSVKNLETIHSFDFPYFRTKELIPTDNVNFLREHWLYGYKKINPNKTSKVLFRPEVKSSKSNDMWESIENSIKEKLRNSDDLIKAGQEAKTSVIDYINNPIIKETAERNTKLSHRLNLKMPYIIEGDVPRRVNNLQEFRQHNFNRPATLSFGHTGNNSLATYASELPALGEKSKITVSWQHFGPKKVLTDNRLKSSIEHELLHHSRFGESNIEQLKAEKLLKPRSELLAPESTSIKYSGGVGQDAEPYLLSRGEGATNMRDLGKELGFPIGLKYPGKTEGMKILDDILPKYTGGKDFIINDLRLNTPRDYKRVWDALTGKYFLIPAGIAGTSLNNE